MDKVICPYCPADKEHPDGVEMLYRERRTPGVGYGYAGRYECPVCGSRAPEIRNVGIDAADLKAFAYAAAMRRYQPENRVLTLEEAQAHVDDPVWCEFKNEIAKNDWYVGYGLVMLALHLYDFWTFAEESPTPEQSREIAEDDYGKTWRCWLRRPTDEERSKEAWK